MSNPTKVLCVAVGLMLGALTLSACFALLTFERTYRDELLTGYYLPVRHLHANLQRAALYGISLENATGVERDLGRAWRALDEFLKQSPAASARARHPALTLISPDGRVLRSAGGSVDARSKDFVSALKLPNAPGESASGTRYFEGRDAIYIPMRIKDEDGTWIASVIGVVDSQAVFPKLLKVRREALYNSIAALASALLVYTLALTLVVRAPTPDERTCMRRLLWTSVGFGVVAQLAGAFAGAQPYRAPYLASTSQKAQVLAELVRQDTESALARGMRMEFLDFRHYPWRDLVRATPEIGALEVRARDRSLVVRVDRDEVAHFQNERLRSLKNPLHGRPDPDDLEVRAVSLRAAGADAGAVAARISRGALGARLLDLAADALAATMVSLLIFVELLLLFYWFLTREPDPASTPAAGAQESRSTDRCGAMRPAAFLFLFGVDLSMSFIPLHMERLYEPLFGLSKDVVLGLPISVEFLFVGVAILVSGAWVDRRGWREPFMTGVALAGVGALYSWLAPDAMNFIASRAVIGVGYGLVLMASQGYVIAVTDARSTARGLAQLFAGIYGGSIGGGVAGAILAERFGFEPVLMCSGFIVFGVLAYALVLLPGSSDVGARAPAAREAATGQGSPLARFLTNRSMLGLILFSSLPASIAAVGFLNYFSPIYLNRIGASQSTIGQVLMLYGVCLVFFGPWVSRSMDTVQRKKLAVLAGCLLGGFAFLSFKVFDGLTAAAVAVVVLGLSHSLVLSSQSAYALSLRVSRELGEGTAISVFRSSGRIGQMLGPIAFSTVAFAGDVADGIAYLGYAYLAAAVLFWLLTRRDRAMLIEANA